MHSYYQIKQTAHPPTENPIMVWDGECDFCAYWINYWQTLTGSKIEYAPYQEVAKDFPDINKRHFMLASRLIDTQGKVYSGPRSAYRSFTYANKWTFLDAWYQNYRWFRGLSDGVYRWVTKNRGLLFKVSKILFGGNPRDLKPFWAIYLGFLIYLIYIFF